MVKKQHHHRPRKNSKVKDLAAGKCNKWTVYKKDGGAFWAKHAVHLKCTNLIKQICGGWKPEALSVVFPPSRPGIH